VHAFIIRPFGVKSDHKGSPINFDVVERELLDPVLRKLGFDGRTTQDIAKAGNIREDMFRLLVTADLAIADISIHNANVFYELGIRHALRDKRTFLLRCRADDPIFDLQGERYLAYERENPAASVPALIEAIRQTRDADSKDSPVFMLLPQLSAQPRSVFLTVPADFSEDVQRAKAENWPGDLELFAEEAGGFEWESEGLRLVGRAQFDLQGDSGGRITWERLREIEGDDLEANTILGTVYQRLGQLAESDLAVRRALAAKSVGPYERAELQSLLGRNAKMRWRAEWDKEQLDQDSRRSAALRSPWLIEARKCYEAGFAEDLNHFYSGVNALALYKIEVELAKLLSDVWEEQFPDQMAAARELDARACKTAELSAAVGLSVQAGLDRLARLDKTDTWALLSEAELRCLTINKPPFVASVYRKALADATDRMRDSARIQLTLYQRLGLLTAVVGEVLKQFEPYEPAKQRAAAGEEPRIVLFTGHRIDRPDRQKPRFPADQEHVAREAIKNALANEKGQPGGVALGIAGGASGGDILFHEVCAELGISTRLFLGIPRDRFVAASVAPAGPSWIERFDRIYSQPYRRQLSNSDELPRWLRGKRNYDIWQRNNLWMLHNALAFGGQRTTVIALWDGGKADGPGGTEHMIGKSSQRGAKTIILDTRKLFGLTSS
jgi:tetratricopeptide repeat protein